MWISNIFTVFAVCWLRGLVVLSWWWKKKKKKEILFSELILQMHCLNAHKVSQNLTELIHSPFNRKSKWITLFASKKKLWFFALSKPSWISLLSVWQHSWENHSLNFLNSNLHTWNWFPLVFIYQIYSSNFYCSFWHVEPNGKIFSFS